LAQAEPAYSSSMMELSEKDIDRMVEAATSVRGRAWAPYSGFAVGAAILGADGCVHIGCNVENASYGLSVCAERHAVAAAIAAGTRVFTAVALVTDSSPPASPCGACRQVLAEFGDFPVILANLAGERRITSVGALLPDAFGPELLSKS
jgi:cytidine deaminase